MIGVIEGGDVLEERLRSAKETAKRPVAGYLLDGFQGDVMAKETKLELLSSVTAELPEDKPRSELSIIFVRNPPFTPGNISDVPVWLLRSSLGDFTTTNPSSSSKANWDRD